MREEISDITDTACLKNVLLKKSGWDSDQLGISCGLIDCCSGLGDADQEQLFIRINEIIKKNSDISFITIKLPCILTEVLNNLVKQTAKFIDTELIYRFRGLQERRYVHCPELNIVFSKTCNPSFFLPLAREMTWSRFYLDDRLPKGKVQSLWTKSIYNHCSGRSHELALAYWKEKPAGLATINFENTKKIRLFIVGVLPEFQQHGIGTNLLIALTKRYGPDFDIIVEASSRNDAARSLYQKIGFALYDMRYIIHAMQ